MAQNCENFILLDRKSKVIDSLEFSELFLKMLDQNRVILVKNSRIYSFHIWERLMIWHTIPLFEAVTESFLYSVSVGHHIIQVEVNQKPKRNADNQEKPWGFIWDEICVQKSARG